MMEKKGCGWPGLIIASRRSDYMFKNWMNWATGFKERTDFSWRISYESQAHPKWSLSGPVVRLLFGPIGPKKGSGISFGPSYELPSRSSRFDIITLDAS